MIKRSRTCSLLILPLIAAAGLAVFVFALTAGNLPGQITATFGPPSPNLSALDRLSLSLRLLRYREALTQAANPYGESAPFQIALGESPTSVSLRLEENGLINHAEAFRLFLIYSGVDTQIQAGNYTLSPANPAIQIALALRDPNPTEATLVILAGWRMEEIGAALPASGLVIPPEDFIAAGQNSNAEGYLFPGSYPLSRQASSADIFHALDQAFNAAVTDELRAGFAQQGLDLHQAVILASIVEREAVVDDEMPLIASVFINRLAAGIKLDADPTVQYAVGYNAAQETWWSNPISLANLQYDSPFNTYLYPGLPPGPICSPGINALRAVAFPAQTPYYFFRATCDGSGRHNFAETFEEHVNNACP